MNIGEEFNQVINKDVLCKISCAATSLYSELIYINQEEAKNIVSKKLEEAKKVVSHYIDEQKTTFLNLIDLT